MGVSHPAIDQKSEALSIFPELSAIIKSSKAHYHIIVLY